jgi:hypothetical protein
MNFSTNMNNFNKSKYNIANLRTSSSQYYGNSISNALKLEIIILIIILKLKAIQLKYS